MATSSKVQFKLATLRQKALESIDFRIDQKALEVESFESEEALQQRVNEWRERQEEKITELAMHLGETDNYRLSRFKLDPIPKVDVWERERAQRDLAALKSQRSRVEAKADSLMPDAEGNISLTKTQLSEFFGL